MPWEMAYRRGRWALANRSWLRRMHVARGPSLRAGTRWPLLYAQGEKGRGCKADPFSAAQPGNEEDMRFGVSKARPRFHRAQRSSRKALFSLFQSFAYALPNAPTRRVCRKKHQRRMG